MNKLKVVAGIGIMSVCGFGAVIFAGLAFSDYRFHHTGELVYEALVFAILAVFGLFAGSILIHDGYHSRRQEQVNGNSSRRPITG